MTGSAYGRPARAVRAIVVLGVVLLAGGCGPSNCARVGGAMATGTPAGDLRAESVLVLANGHVLIGGVSEPKLGGEERQGCDGELTVLRLDARGELDTGFGKGGAARLRPYGEGCVSSVDRLFQGRDGRTLVAMTIFEPSETVMEDTSSLTGDLVALTSDGHVDDSFKGEFEGGRFAVSPDGSIFSDLGARYLPNGDADPRDQRARIPVGDSSRGVDIYDAVDVAAQRNGKKLFLGLQSRGNRASYRRLAIERFDSDGQPDMAFGNHGIATADVAPGKRLVKSLPELQRVLPASGGGMIAFGLAFGPKRSYAFAIKFDATGHLDRSFGDHGRVEIGPPTPDREIYDLATAPDGNLMAIGSSGYDRASRLFVARYHLNGKPDRRFGRSGQVTIDRLRPPRNVNTRELDLEDLDVTITAGLDGTTVGVASTTYPSKHNGSAVQSLAFRLRPNGTLDPSFGHHGYKHIQRLG
jgi:uncharacterized delta-60 repeat protein